MAATNGTNNVFRGSESLRDYYDPDVAPPLPLVELPPQLNPHLDEGVHIYAKMMTMLPAHNVKQLPALNMLREVDADKTDTIVEYSSGSTVISMSILSRVLHGIYDTHAYLSNKTSGAKLQLMQFFGLNITLFGGPSQPEPCDPRGGIQVARQEANATAAADGTPGAVFNANQYENARNWQAHCKWTGPQILQQLPEVGLVCIGMGTSGTMTGNGQFFQAHKPGVTRLGVCTAAGQRVPGPRSRALMGPVQFPWQDSIDAMEEVGEHDSYRLSMALSREGLVCGPSSGFNLQGLYQFLAKRTAARTLDALKNERGELHCVFLCCDLPYQYMSEYFTKLPPEAFPAIRNEQLSGVDVHRYDEAWEIDGATALAHEHEQRHATSGLDRMLLDFRTARDFAASHLRDAVSMPLDTLPAATTTSPFRDANVLQRQWRELDRLFDAAAAGLDRLRGRRVYLLCYDGDTSRVASSILRARGIEAFSLRGGWASLAHHPSSASSPRASPPDINVEASLQVDHARRSPYALHSPYTPLVSPSAVKSVAG